MTTSNTLIIFNTENAELDATERMVIKNKAAERAGSDDVFCTVEHPEGWAVVDIKTAIELGGPYSWSYN